MEIYWMKILWIWGTYRRAAAKYGDEDKRETNSYNVHCIQPGIIIAVVNDAGNKGFLSDRHTETKYKKHNGSHRKGKSTKWEIERQEIFFFSSMLTSMTDKRKDITVLLSYDQ